MGAVNAASRRAFILCDSFMRRIAPSMGVEVGDLPDVAGLPASSTPTAANSTPSFMPGGNGNGNGSCNGNGNGNGGEASDGAWG
ncbi:hypothetical protein CNMCM6936_007040 [Aspergillus lentulus]|nr:hypothetical protein CNMCM6069_003229 [Aspergillus lentulus]KAF4155755.1 hypothetical protein CNMCM6936_007040 [Aspergillus lentulus]KAF4190717.1 hypothetical protein CNMCM8694_003076 [Aspergillus lentulus]KAF4200450.1 hypothetical protein CNMCM8927_003066 [Aspergillus lentulus]